METQREAMTLDEICNILTEHGIYTHFVNLDKYGFSRTIAFNVYGIWYKIEWYKNQSTLYVGEGSRAACLPFKWIYFDQCYPLQGGNKSIGFSYVRYEKESIFDREFPYEVFRIPIEIK